MARLLCWRSLAPARYGCMAELRATRSSSSPGASPRFCLNGVTILAETALKPEEIDKARAEADRKRGEKMWSEAGDDAAKYEEANEVIHKAEAELAAAEGRE